MGPPDPRPQLHGGRLESPAGRNPKQQPRNPWRSPKVGHGGVVGGDAHHHGNLLTPIPQWFPGRAASPLPSSPFRMVPTTLSCSPEACPFLRGPAHVSGQRHPARAGDRRGQHVGDPGENPLPYLPDRQIPWAGKGQLHPAPFPGAVSSFPELLVTPAWGSIPCPPVSRVLPLVSLDPTSQARGSLLAQSKVCAGPSRSFLSLPLLVASLFEHELPHTLRGLGGLG